MHFLGLDLEPYNYMYTYGSSCIVVISSYLFLIIWLVFNTFVIIMYILTTLKPHIKRNHVHADKFHREIAIYVRHRIRTMIMFCTCIFNLFPIFYLILSILVATFTSANTCNKPYPETFD